MITREAWQRSITDDQGNLLTGVQISVFQEDGTTPATIYSGLTDAAMANPFNTGVQTVARFYAEPGLYVVRAFKAGVGTQEWVNVDISGFSVRQDLSAIGGPIGRPVMAQLLNGNGGTFAATNVSLAAMVMVPSEFLSIRIGYAHRGGSGGVVGAKLLVAVTDDIGDLSQTQTVAARKYVVPIRNGVENNTIGAGGWVPVTWGGSATLNMADAGANNFTFAWSDPIAIEGVDLALLSARERFAGYRPLLVRMFAGTGSYTKGGLVGFGETTKFIAECGPRLQLGSAKAGDAVTDVSTWGTGSTVSFGDDKSIPIMVEPLIPLTNVRSILCAGDSRFASSSEFPDRFYRNTQFFIEKEYADNGKIGRCVSVSQGGQTMDAYWQRAVAYIDAGGYADAALYLAYSINDGVPGTALMQRCKVKLLGFIDKCVKAGIEPFVIVAFPLGVGYTESSVAVLNDFVSFVQKTGVKHINPLAIYSINESYGWNPVYQFDNSHMNDIGYQDLAARIYSLIETGR